ncbi:MULTISPECIES: hypothetical protein [Geothrix]|uniref:hypothetical protein n=1 Tax=Geothrix TaxID=44675 RepID=UPI001FAC65F0|nr:MULTISPECIES: hypothetical protein [Geothrix]
MIASTVLWMVVMVLVPRSGPRINPQELPALAADPKLSERLGSKAEAEGKYAEARRHYEEACRLDADWGEENQPPFGEASVLLKLARLLRDPKCGPPDLTRAGRCYVAALGIGSNQWSAEAWIELIKMYRDGLGVPKDPGFSKHLLEEFRFKAGNMHWSKEDSRRLALMWEKGDFLPRNLLAASSQFYLAGDIASARKALEKGADEGDPSACEKLAWSYQGQGLVVTDIDPKRANAYLLKAKSLRSAITSPKPQTNPEKPRVAMRAWGGDAGPPQEASDESLGSEKQHELSQTPDPVRGLYHRLWAEYLSPKD